MHNQDMNHQPPKRTVVLQVVRDKDQLKDLQKRREQRNLHRPITSGSQLLSWSDLLGEK